MPIHVMPANAIAGQVLGGMQASATLFVRKPDVRNERADFAVDIIILTIRGDRKLEKEDKIYGNT